MTNPRLKVNKYYVDSERAHIKLKRDPDPEVFFIVQKICPASLYTHNSDGFHYDYTGCLECGSCLIVGGEAIFSEWGYPRHGHGVDYGEDAD